MTSPADERYAVDSQLIEILCRDPENETALKALLGLLDAPIQWNCKQLEFDYDDVLQEVMLLLCQNQWARLKSWNRESSLKTWLSCVVHNLCLNLINSKRYRKTKAAKLPEEIEDHRKGIQELDRAMDLSTKFSHLMLAMEKLPPEQSYVLTQKYLHSRSNDDIAQELGKTSNHIGVISHRAITSLRSLLGGSIDE